MKCRYAMMREVADFESGNFRGVCPILNRAKKLFQVALLRFVQGVTGCLYACPGMADFACGHPGFMMSRRETPGSV
ncbi:MAG: hypothetical protein IJW78_02945 [Clostridia bacterium]|nr:hypothetical protein [Clostridia bacterium]